MSNSWNGSGNSAGVAVQTPPASVPASMPALVAFGERLGLEVPTRYDEKTHEWANLAMIADSLVTPLLTGMSPRTVWVCRALAALLALTRTHTTSVTLKQRLQIELATGIALIVLALRGEVSRRAWENLYLGIGGILMVANALMTES